jgi:hypothetical protein
LNQHAGSRRPTLLPTPTEVSEVVCQGSPRHIGAPGATRGPSNDGAAACNLTCSSGRSGSSHGPDLRQSGVHARGREYWYEKAIEAGSDHALHWRSAPLGRMRAFVVPIVHRFVHFPGLPAELATSSVQARREHLGALPACEPLGGGSRRAVAGASGLVALASRDEEQPRCRVHAKGAEALLLAQMDTVTDCPIRSLDQRPRRK